jgi:hypothetical protein
VNRVESNGVRNGIELLRKCVFQQPARLQCDRATGWIGLLPPYPRLFTWRFASKGTDVSAWDGQCHVYWHLIPVAGGKQEVLSVVTSVSFIFRGLSSSDPLHDNSPLNHLLGLGPHHPPSRSHKVDIHIIPVAEILHAIVDAGYASERAHVTWERRAGIMDQPSRRCTERR